MAGENKHTGHRKRVKEEFRIRGLEGMAEHRVLELLLFFAIPQGDVNPLAHDLIDQFGSLAGVFHATHEQLMAVKGVGENTATLIRLIPALGGRYLQSCVSIDQIYQNSWQFRELLAPVFFGARNEMAYIVCMDGKHKLLTMSKVGEGTPDSTTITTRRVMETALACNASVVVLAHNHVSGLAIPSAEDVMTTRQLKKNLQQVGIELYDHFIVVEGDMVSMRESGCLNFN